MTVIERDEAVIDWEVENREPASQQTTTLNDAGSRSSSLIEDAAAREATRHIHSHFLANITHEFRTPLSVLDASVEYLLDDFNQLTRNEIRELLKSIHLGVVGLQTLIDNLLESTNIEAGRFMVRPGPIKIEDVVTEAIEVMRPFVDRRQQRVVVNKTPTLPLVYGDLPRLTQVLVNLLSNASKFGPMGQTIRVDLALGEDSYVRVAVADRGPGIPLEDRVNLFQRFLRLDCPDGAQYGIGLGLSVVRIIVEEHGGNVGVDTRTGGGSVFWFTIPLAA